MGEGPISWLSVDAYATARGFDEEQRDDLQAFIRAMDSAYMKHKAEQAERDRKRGKHGGDKPQSNVVRPKNPKGGRGHRARG
jgi:hypothetical protein